MDLNDNPPMFVNQPYYAVVSKEAARDSQGMQMEIVKKLIIEELIDKILNPENFYSSLANAIIVLFFFILLNVPGTYYLIYLIAVILKGTQD